LECGLNRFYRGYGLRIKHLKTYFLVLGLFLVVTPIQSFAHVSGVFNHSDQAKHDERNPEHSMILSFALQDETTQKIWAVGEFGTILSTEDLGETWIHSQSTPTEQTLTTICFKTPLVGFAAGYDSQILKTEDGGKNWSLVHQAPDWEQPIFKIYPFEKYVIAIGAYGLFLVSHDEGESWSRIKLPFDNAHLYDMTPLGNDEFLLVGEMGSIRKAVLSPEGEFTFTEIHALDKKSIFGIYPEREGRFVLLGLQGNLSFYDLTTNAFQSQTLEPASSLFGYDQMKGRKILVGASGHLYMGSVDDESFSAHQLASSQNLSDVFLLSPDLALVCGDGGIEKVHLSSLPMVRDVIE
jgi:photosystem II stability/assembly factor-like uncharacterized protein